MGVELAKRQKAAPRRARAKRVGVLALADCTPLPVVGVADLLRKAVDVAPLIGLRAPPIEVSMISAGRHARLRTAGGIELVCDTIAREAPPLDVLVVSALDPDVLAHLEQNRSAVELAAKAYRRGADVWSLCTGAFVLAEAGLLDGRDAATHWAFSDLFATRYPRVRLVPNAVVVDHGRICTAAGATSFLPMTLLLIERLMGVEVARAASKMFLIDVNKSPQSAYAMFASQMAHGDEGVLRAQRDIERAPGADWSISELAKIAGASVRSFNRRFKLATANTPREYLQRVRVEVAKRALESNERTVVEIASMVGYSDPVAFRRLFVGYTGLTPTEYRARYGPRISPVWLDARHAGRADRSRGVGGTSTHRGNT